MAFGAADHAQHGHAEEHGVEQEVLDEVELQEAVSDEDSRLSVDLLHSCTPLLDLLFHHMLQLVSRKTPHPLGLAKKLDVGLRPELVPFLVVPEVVNKCLQADLDVVSSLDGFVDILLGHALLLQVLVLGLTLDEFSGYSFLDEIVRPLLRSVALKIKLE